MWSRFVCGGLVDLGVLAIMLILFVPLLVSCPAISAGKDYVTLFRDDMGEEIPDWDWEHIWGTGGHEYDGNGNLILRITRESTSQEMSLAALEDQWEESRWRYVGLEVRLRCSDDNRMVSDVGGGARCFGFYTQDLKNQLRFTCTSPESEPEFQGLRAISIVDGKSTLNEAVMGVDISEWHTYTYLWEEGNGTFLVDGEVVATTDSPPTEPMSIFVYIANARLTGTLDQYTINTMDLDIDAHIQVDFVRTFVDAGRFAQMDSEISDLLSRSRQLLAELEGKGVDTTALREEHEKAEADWQVDHYIYETTGPRLEKIVHLMEHHDEVIAMFSEVNEAITTLEREGRDREAAMSRGDYSRAEKAWAELDYESTCDNLQKVVARVSEIFSALSGLMLLITVFRPRSRSR
jgi:hypothetical protein